MIHARLFAVSLTIALLPTIAFAQGPNAAGIQFFESKIRPVLVTHCYECHSAQSKKLKGSLLLDNKAGVLKGGISGAVIVPGKGKESLLVKALMHDGDTKMPKEKLSNEIIADFVKWIDMGAPDPRAGKIAAIKKEIDIDKGKTFWSFRPLIDGTLPKIKNEAWAKTPIDRFIMAKLEEKSLTPNGPASKERLLRRAFYDLTGLPPTPAEIETFMSDAAADAYAKLIDRLLESERFGERWARHWLDLVRYAESGGYEFDKDRPSAHHYRDFVIKALNQDMPFDQFVRLQIAGDQMKPGDLLATSATGFLVAGPFPGQTTSKTLQLIRYDHLDDMLATLGSSMLGLSLGCARCHEHKYDPIPQEDYYRLLANLGRTDSVDAKINTEPTAYQQAKLAFDLANAPLVKVRDDYEKDEITKRLQKLWDTNKDKPVPAWLILDPVEAKGKATLATQADGSALATGKAQKNDAYTIVAHTTQKKIKALRLEAMADKSLPKSGPGLGADGGFVLSEVTVVATPLNAAVKAKIKPLTVKLKAGQATAQDAKFPLSAAVDGNAKTGWSVGDQLGKDHAATFEFDGDVGFDGGTMLTITLKFDNDHYAIGRPRVAITTSTAKVGDKAEPQVVTELLTLLAPSKGQWTAAQRDAITPWIRKIDAQADLAYRNVETHAKLEPQPKLVNVFSAMGNRGGDVYFLIRGEVDKKRELTKPGFAQVLTSHEERDAHWLTSTSAPPKKTLPLPKKGPKNFTPMPVVGESPDTRGPSGEPRIALANWLVDAEHGAGHLVARVIVNRLWQHHMGKGIVATPNDFGAQGDAPTHPELLDYLARELVNNGWKLKPIHKLIMTSAVYQLSGEATAEQIKADPANKLWWRHPTRRLEAEAIRDAVLAVSGTLDTAMYGPGTLNASSPRRSIYLTVKRSQMIPLLTMFDVPEALQSIGERSITTVPTQSLAFMNSSLVRSSAQKLATRIRPKTPETMGQAIDQAYLTALSRRPSEAERERMQSFIDRQAVSYGSTPQAREQALVDFCQVMLCLNEFIYVD